MKENLEIVPAERIGPYYLKWDVDTLKKNLPSSYLVSENKYFWFVEFEDYLIRIRKEDEKINSITVYGKFKQHFMNKITSKSTLRDIENEFEYDLADNSAFILLKYPGIEIYTEEEKENDEDEEGWKNVRVTAIAVTDPNFIWNDHFSYDDYVRMGNTNYECPFPLDKMVKNKA
jgi:hypothetical protein